MPTVGTANQQAQYSHEGVGLKEVSGGAKKMRYWTPDGREKFAVPAMRTYRMTRSGAEGVRDANLDKGWLLQKPTELKPYCPHCDNWHDNQKEIDACGAKKKSFYEEYEAKARKMKGQEGGAVAERVDKLESDISDIKSLLTQLLKQKE